MFFQDGSHPRLCLENKLEFSYRAHLVPTFTFGETEVYDQVLFHKDSRMYKFQSCFRRIFGFYFCVFYGQSFCQGSTGLLPYARPIVTVGECHSQPQCHLRFLNLNLSLAPPKKTAAEGKVGADLGCESQAKGRRGRLKEEEVLTLSFSLFPSLLAVGEPLPLPQIENPSQEMVDKYHALYMDALHKLFDQHKTHYGCSETQKLFFL